MKSKMLCLLGMISVITSCSNDDDLSQEIPISELVTPKVTATVSDQTSESPMTGILEAYPCESGNSIYYGNYVDGKLTPFNGYYRIFEGHTYGEYNRVLKRLLSLVSHLALMFPNCILLFVPIMTAPTCLFSIWCTLLRKPIPPAISKPHSNEWSLALRLS